MTWWEPNMQLGGIPEDWREWTIEDELRNEG